MAVIESPRFLLIDSYDSFTNNLAALLRAAIPGCGIYIIKNDGIPTANIPRILSAVDAVIVGPGPGSPDSDVDVGIVKHIWHVSSRDLLPIFGVCLGFQSLALAHGGLVAKLPVVKHGQISRLRHTGTSIFRHVGEVDAVRYHSWRVILQDASDIEPLAWACDDINGEVIMAAKHVTKPFWGVQYHPESVCTHGGGIQVIRNWWMLSKAWLSYQNRALINGSRDHGHILLQCSTIWPPPPLPSAKRLRSFEPKHPRKVLTKKLSTNHLDLLRICDVLGAADEHSGFIFLDPAAQPGRYAIICALDETSKIITHSCADRHVKVTTAQSTKVEQFSDGEEVWSWLHTLLVSQKAMGGYSEVPFWGGTVGLISYEAGVTALGVRCPIVVGTQQSRPDIVLVEVTRSIVVDTFTGVIYVQSLLSGDQEWIQATSSMLHIACERTLSLQDRDCPTEALGIALKPPDKNAYMDRIREAQKSLFDGDSYELCVTATSRVDVRYPFSKSSIETSRSWELYKSLRKNNPAPHAAYMRLHPLTFMSSSPERFLSCSRSLPMQVQMRPIKGTLSKSEAPMRTLAEKLLGTPKERAENLMIVDLIRHDLHGLVGENVGVSHFCRVEEYETVWQLVSVIEGSHEQSVGPAPDPRWTLLRSTLPPGSMTGAPKKRSVEILQVLEDEKRELYSGVFGYWCAGGGGDWAVTIRSAFHYDDEIAEVQNAATGRKETIDKWKIGAGGAITALSNPEAEWAEMIAKLQSVIRGLGPGITPSELS